MLTLDGRFTGRPGLYRVTLKGHNARRACVGENCNSVRACTGDKKKKEKQQKQKKNDLQVNLD